MKQFLKSKPFFIIVSCIILKIVSHYLVEEIQSTEPDWAFEIPSTALPLGFIISKIHFLSIIMLSSALIITGITYFKKMGRKMWLLLLIPGVTLCLYQAHLNLLVYNGLKEVSDPLGKIEITCQELKKNHERRVHSPPTKKKISTVKLIALAYYLYAGVCLDIFTENGELVPYQPPTKDIELRKKQQETYNALFSLQRTTLINTILLMTTIPFSILAGILISRIRKKQIS